MSVNPRARSRASSGSSNWRSVTTLRNSPIASASISLLPLSLIEVVELPLLLRRQRPLLLQLGPLVGVDYEDVIVIALFVEVHFHRLDRLVEHVEEGPIVRLDNIAGRLRDLGEELVEGRHQCVEHL